MRPILNFARNILAVIGGLVLAWSIFVAFLLGFSTNSRVNSNPAKQAEMIELTLKWGQLAPFPHSNDFFIHTEGNSFTRTFRGSFSDSPEIILKWLKESPGIADGTFETLPDKSVKYILKTGGGASYGEVFVSPDQSHVSFRVSWS